MYAHICAAESLGDCEWHFLLHLSSRVSETAVHDFAFWSTLLVLEDLHEVLNIPCSTIKANLTLSDDRRLQTVSLQSQLSQTDPSCSNDLVTIDPS